MHFKLWSLFFLKWCYENLQPPQFHALPYQSAQIIIENGPRKNKYNIYLALKLENIKCINHQTKLNKNTTKKCRLNRLSSSTLRFQK